MNRFPYIDALRGYAVLGVLLVHTGQEAGFPNAPVAAGARGVQLFFVASALTLLMSWHDRNDGAGAFFIRRAFRILPMFWLAFALYLNGPIDAHVIAAALVLQGARPEWIFADVVPGGWSICAEVAFYLCFPLLVMYVTTLRRAIIFLVGTLVVSRIWRSTGLSWLPLVYPDVTHDELWHFMYFTLPAQLPAFAAGIACFFLLPTFERLRRQTLELILLASFAGVTWFAFYKGDNIAAFAGLFAIGTACIANGAGRYLVNPIVAHIGRCSFSIYLLHWLVMRWANYPANYFDGAPKFMVLFAGTVILATVVSSAAYVLIERPMVRLGNKLIRSLQARGRPTARMLAADNQAAG